MKIIKFTSHCTVVLFYYLYQRHQSHFQNPCYCLKRFRDHFLDAHPKKVKRKFCKEKKNLNE